MQDRINKKFFFTSSLKKLPFLLLFLLSSLNSSFVYSDELGDYYWQIPVVSPKSHPTPSAACDAYLSLSRAGDINGSFDWQMGSLTQIITGDGRPNFSCILVCGPGKNCSGNIGVPVYATDYQYIMGSLNNDRLLNECVGNPINPVSGNKYQFESLITQSGLHAINFNLIYNSQRQEKWRHSFTQSVVSISNAQRPSNTIPSRAFCSNNTLIVESSGGFGDAVEESIIVDAPRIFWPKPRINKLQPVRSSARDACELNWTSWLANGYQYAWISGSSATYLGGGICSIRDANSTERMRLDVYTKNTGIFAGFPFSSCADLDPTILPKLDSSDPINVRFTRHDGRLVRYIYNSITSLLENESNTDEKAEFIVNGVDIIGYRFYNNNDEVEEYDTQGKLISITALDGYVQTLSYVTDAVTENVLLNRVQNATGEYIQFTYEVVGVEHPFNRILTVTDYDSRIWTFRYDINDNLQYIDLPDATIRQYHYEDIDTFDLLTGITDERGQRYASWTYNTNDKADSSAHGSAKDIDKVTITYNEGTSSQHTVTKVRHSELNDTTVNFDSIYKTHSSGGSGVVAAITGNNDVQYEYNPFTGYLEYKIEHGLRTNYSNYTNGGDAKNITEAVGTGFQRQTSYTYDARFHRKIATITEASVSAGQQKITTNIYDDFGNNTSVIIDGFKPDGSAVSRITTFQYNGPYYQLSQIDGPRTDVSDIYTISYYADTAAEGNNRARMRHVTAPLNIFLYSNLTYTPTGKIQSYLDENNIQATFSYFYGNERLQTLLQEDLNTGEKRLAEWAYLATGEVKTITTGFDANDKITLTINYDDARRLNGIVDGLGNAIEYILDSEGNVEQENIRDASDILKKQLTQTFDSYDRLQLRTQVNEQFTETWSSDSTLDKTVDGKNVTTNYGYDALKRLTTITQDKSGTSPQTANALTTLNYDVQDNLNYVKNPVNGETVYSYDDLGNQLSRTSNDTGLTSYSHDNAGNIISMTDANGEVMNYSYDALNRLTSIATSNTEDDHQFQYDGCKNGIGRLCKVSSSNSVQYYQYDAFGNVTGQQALQYVYDTANRLDTVTYPSGGVVNYDYDLAGQVQQVSLVRNGSTTPLALNIAYEPFGDVNNLLYGNGLTLSQSKDTAYRPLTQNILSVFELNYIDYDENGNLKQRDDAVANSSAMFAYDEYNRLIIAAGDFGARSYSYDKNANRTGLTKDGSSIANTYESQSNRLSMRGLEDATLDNNGNTLNIGARDYSYTRHNRLFEVFDNGVLKATYKYNGLGQRISKILPDETGKYFIYDTDGKLMAETDINGNILFEYIYLNGQLLAKYSPDTDIDGISNYEENKQGTNPINPDQDGDGLSDIDEMFIHGTSVSNNDSDGDGISDSEELAFNSDPLDGNTNYGDINLDGALNVGDYVVLMQFVLGTRLPNPTEQEQADINQDGVLNVQDLLLMQRVLLGLQLSWFDFSTEGLGEVFAQLYQGIIPSAYAANGDGDIYFVHNNHLGTPIKMTNDLGFVVWVAVYDPFGKATVNEDVDGDGVSVGMNVRFPGQYYDLESGLHYNYFRDYDPNLGRYIESDPIGLDGGINTYVYALNNPLANIDPYGLRPVGNGDGPSGKTGCILICTDNYLISLAGGAATGAAFGAAAGPGGSAIAAIGGTIGRAMNVTVLASCIKSCKDDDDDCQ